MGEREHTRMGLSVRTSLNTIFKFSELSAHGLPVGGRGNLGTIHHNIHLSIYYISDIHNKGEIKISK